VIWVFFFPLWTSSVTRGRPCAVWYSSLVAIDRDGAVSVSTFHPSGAPMTTTMIAWRLIFGDAFLLVSGSEASNRARHGCFSFVLWVGVLSRLWKGVK